MGKHVPLILHHNIINDIIENFEAGLIKNQMIHVYPKRDYQRPLLHTEKNQIIKLLKAAVSKSYLDKARKQKSQAL